MKIVLCLVLLLPSFALAAAGFSVEWKHPTHNIDNGEIPARGSTAIKQTLLEWGECSADEKSIVGKPVGRKTVYAPAATAYIDGGLELGKTYCVRAFTQNCSNDRSDTSNVVPKRALSQPGPRPQDPELDERICSS